MYAGDLAEGDDPRVGKNTIGELFDTIITKPATIPEGATLRDAVKALLAAESTRKAYVVDATERPIGVVTVETLMRHVGYRLGARKEGVLPWFRFVRDMQGDEVQRFMDKPTTVTKATTLIDLVGMVVERKLNDFPVVDDEGRLVGEVNTYHLLRATQEVFDR